MSLLGGKAMAGVAVLLLAIIGYQYFQIAGYRVAAAENGKAAAELNAQLGIAEANNSVLSQSIAKQNASIEAAAMEATWKRSVAVAARDKAMADLASMQENYASLKNSWPKDCVVAVGMARRELGLL